MIRVVLVLLAILIAVLALVFEQWWLYAVAGVALATALVLVWRSLAPASSPASSSRSSAAGPNDRSDEPMEQFGIMSIRPQERNEQSSRAEAASDDGAPEASASTETASAPSPSAPSSSPASSSPASSPPRAQSPSSDDASASTASTPSPAARDLESPVATESEENPPGSSADRSEDAPADDRRRASSQSPTDEPASSNGASDEEARSTQRDPLLSPYLQALRTALRARVAAFVVQEDVALEYRVKAIEGGVAVVTPGDTFTTRQPLLTASTAHQPVTVHNLVSKTDREQLLKYDSSAGDVQHLVLAPLTRRQSHDLSFLLVDGSDVLDTSRSHAVLERFADTLALVLDHQVEAPDQGDTSSSDVPELNEDELIGRDTPVADASRVPVHSDPSPEEPVEETPDEDAEHKPRPRSEIIAEEMESAYTSNREMALVLVHLNRAESLGRQGDGVVRRGEERLRSYLQKRAPESRVTRFGELTYGVFVHEPLDMVGPWALDLQDELDHADGLLKGGASIGVAVWNHHDPPEVFRANATEALREAYITGDCTLIE